MKNLLLLLAILLFLARCSNEIDVINPIIKETCYLVTQKRHYSNGTYKLFLINKKTGEQRSVGVSKLDYDNYSTSDTYCF